MVSIRVNGTPVDQKMRLGSDGEAYFLSEIRLDEDGEVMSPMVGLSPVSSLAVVFPSLCDLDFHRYLSVPTSREAHFFS